MTVTFDPNLCRHTGICLRGLPTSSTSVSSAGCAAGLERAAELWSRRWAAARQGRCKFDLRPQVNDISRSENMRMHANLRYSNDCVDCIVQWSDFLRAVEADRCRDLIQHVLSRAPVARADQSWRYGLHQDHRRERAGRNR